MKGLIISSGEVGNYKLLLSLLQSHDFILCADGGIRHLMAVGAIPHLLIGDLDSVDEIGLDYINKNNIKLLKYPVMKDETDTELALDYLIDKGFDDITLVGVTGSRMDHTLSNIFLLKSLNHKGVKGKIVDANNIIYYSNNYIKLKREEDSYTSVIPLSNNGVVVTLQGFLFPLENHMIRFGSSLGVSNKIISEYGIVKIIEGECLIITSKD